MKITFLGTGASQGIPIMGNTHPVCLSEDFKDKRLRSSILVEWDNYSYIVDCGPDFRQQMLAAKVQHIDGILFTHYHADHTAGLDEVRSFSQRQGEIPFYAKKEVIKNLKERFGYIFTKKNKYKGAADIVLNKIKNKPFLLGNLEIIPIEVLHGKLKIFGFRFDDFAYITDANFVSDIEKQKIAGVKALVINALSLHAHPSHFSLQEALDFIAEIQPKKAYITHVGHRLGFHAAVSKTLPENVFLAYDNLTIEV